MRDNGTVKSLIVAALLIGVTPHYEEQFPLKVSEIPYSNISWLLHTYSLIVDAATNRYFTVTVIV